MYTNLSIVTRRVSDRAIMLHQLLIKHFPGVRIKACLDNSIYTDYKGIVDIFKSESDLISDLVESKVNAVVYCTFGPDILGSQLSLAKIPYIFDYKDLFCGLRRNRLSKNSEEIELDQVSLSRGVICRDLQGAYYLKCNSLSRRPMFFLPDLYHSTMLGKDGEETSNRPPLINQPLGKPPTENPLKIFCTGQTPHEKYIGEDFAGITSIIVGYLEQGAFVTIVGTASNGRGEGDVVSSDALLELSRSHSNLNIVPALKHHDFLKCALTHDFAFYQLNSDYASCSKDAEGVLGMPALKLSALTRVFMYAQAGLPTVLSPQFDFMHNMLKGTGILVSAGATVKACFESLVSLKASASYQALRRKRVVPRMSEESVSLGLRDFVLSVFNDSPPYLKAGIASPYA